MDKNGIRVDAKLNYWEPAKLFGGEITAVPARHGHSWMARFMANGAGLHLELPGETSIYISGDTVYTADVEKALMELQPDIAVVAAGGASLDVGGPILMPLEEVLKFTAKAPHKVVANHMEALNHCPITRSKLRQELETNGLASKVLIPNDGEVLTIAKTE